MNDLATLARKHKTDKIDYHGYIPIYEELLAGKTIKRMLEIGLGTPQIMAMTPAQQGYRAGASLFMWQDYFPEAQIYGIDILPEALVNEGNIKSFQCDQGQEAQLRFVANNLIGGDLDFVVDDGSHHPLHQALTARVFVPMLAPGGILVIEDIADPSLLLPLVRHMNPELREPLVISDDRMLIFRA
jgi:SAM-dependent methyltransferase